MEVFQKATLLTACISKLRKKGQSIGFVPTMGALHAGHISLVHQCGEQNDIVVASIFVNPTQFNDPEDLKKYPRMPEKDLPLLEAAGCHLVFMPDVQQVYPIEDRRTFDFGGLDSCMEGAHRPGHFQGVAQVVTRFFDIIMPDRAYFGLKDFQQLAIIKKVSADLQYPVEIVPCAIVREADGLAMSSRNMRLNPNQRREAVAISQILFQAADMRKGHTPEQVKAFVEDAIRKAPGVIPEYFEIVHPDTLQPIIIWPQTNAAVGCVAAWVGGVRLIDNIIFSS
jgi:pantoate--beta-alanine ligase